MDRPIRHHLQLKDQGNIVEPGQGRRVSLGISVLPAWSYLSLSRDADTGSVQNHLLAFHGHHYLHYRQRTFLPVVFPTIWWWQ